MKNAWKLLLDTLGAPLDLEYIKNIHRALGRFTIINNGSLRTDEVRIGGIELDNIPDKDELLQLKTIA